MPSAEEKAIDGAESLVRAGGPESIEVSIEATRTANCCGSEAVVFPAASVARTSKLCGPLPTVAVYVPESQPAQSPPSRRHSKLVASGEEKVKVGVSSFDFGAGPESTLISGASVSTLK